MSEKDISPDDTILNELFGEVPVKVSVILQTWEKCIFKVDFPNQQQEPVAVRLEIPTLESKDNFVLTSVLQNFAASVCPDFVPTTHKIGKVKNAEEVLFSYSIVDFVSGVTLQDVWQDLTLQNQEGVVAEIVQVLRSLQDVRLDAAQALKLSNATEKLASETSKPIINSKMMGGPNTGFLATGMSLLDAILEKWKLKNEFCSLRHDADGSASIRSLADHDILPLSISKDTMDSWIAESTLCHNDITPRNIILRETGSEPKHYKLAAIIDWELAGFYPASYQIQLQDVYLGTSSQHLSFYLLLKERMADLAPRTPTQEALLRAMEIIFQSRHEFLAARGNVPAIMRQKYFEMMYLSRDVDLYHGWTCLEEPPKYNADAMEKLEDDAIEEMMARRAARLNAASLEQ